MADRLAEANELATSEGVGAAILASSSAYIGFALSNPGVFRIMFRPDHCDPSRFPDVQQAGARAPAEPGRLVRIVHDRNANPAQAAIYWAHVHGMACLMIDGPLASYLPAGQDREAYLREVGRQFADLIMPLVRPFSARHT